MIDEVEKLEVDAVDFQVACRRYTIHATITRDRQLPVVDEFVLRLLAILDRVPSARLRSWFGFSNAEMETVLVDIARRGHIAFEGEDVVLSTAGRDLFKFSGADDAPRVVEVAPLIADVWFDLVGRSMVPRSPARPGDYLVKLKEIPGARELPESFAREAFEQNFRDYVRRIRRLPDADAVNLYSISNVEGGAYGYQVVEAGLALDMDRLTVRPTFGEAAENSAGFHRLAIAAGDAWQYASAPDLSSAAGAELERLTGDDRLAALLSQPDNIEFWTAALVRAENAGSGYLPTLGATYLRRNLTRLIALVHAVGPAVPDREIIWARPGGAAWGRTAKVSGALTELRNALSGAGAPDVETTLLVTRSTPKPLRTAHRRFFTRGRLSPQGHLPPNIEILLLPDVAAIINVHIPVGRHAVPIGGLVTDKRRLARIVDRLRPARSDGWDDLWQPAKARDD